MLLFVAACFILLYWPVIDSFFALLKQGYLFNLLLLRHFASLRETLMCYECFVQLNLNVTPVTLLNFGGTAQKEIEICFQPSWWVVSNLGLVHMMVQCALRYCATCIGTILNKCWTEAIELLSFTIKWAKIVPTQTWCLLLSYTKLYITSFISRWKHILLLRLLSPGTVYAFR